MSKQEFCDRFIARMLERASTYSHVGPSIAEYAKETAPTYYEDPMQRAEGPEACAESDISYWGED